MATRSKLEDLDLTTGEIEQLGKAFKDEKFRELFQAYADEISNPENKKKYEEEITLMEKERGMDIKFVHPQPGRVLKTSLNGVQTCYINICSNELVPKPGCEAGEGKDSRKGQHWSLPYSLAPGREDLGKEGRKHMIYDVVFHPDTLHLACRNERFRQMVDSTAVEAIEKQFGVTLDEKNAKVLKLKYKGLPQAAVLRTPLAGKPQQTVDADDPLRFPYPYETGKCDFPGANATESQRGKALAQVHETVAHQTVEDRQSKQVKPTTPRYTIVHRSHFDLQDYRYSRDAAPSPIPKELVVTIDLPLLKSAEQATLDVAEKHLNLESRKPDYCLQIALPYRVDENHGTATFNKAKKQLVVTLPVLPQMCPVAMAMRQDISNNDEINEETLANEPADGAEAMWQAEAITLNSDKQAQSPCFPTAETQICNELKLQDRAKLSERELAKDKPEGGVGNTETAGQIQERIERDSAGLNDNFSKDPQTSKETAAISSQERFSVQSNLQTNELVHLSGKKDGLKCPTFQCTQDELSISLVLHVLNIQKESLKEDVSANQYHICFCSRDNITYSLIVQFPLHNNLNTKGTVISISRNNAVVELSKSSESTGLWKKLYFGVNSDSLQEKLFVSEENVDEFLEEVLNPLTMKQSALAIKPLIEVLKITDSQSHIRLKEHGTDEYAEKKEGINVLNTSEIRNDGSPETKSAVLATDTAKREHTIEDDEASLLTTEGKTAGRTGLGSDYCLQPQTGIGSLPLAKEHLVSKPDCDPATISSINTASVNSGKESFPQCGEGADENELDEDDIPTKQQEGDRSSAVAPAIKQINMEDGSVQLITDHTTHCAFTFQNSVLYDLD